MEPHRILEAMLQQDAFSRWLGIQVAALETGYCRLTCIIWADMLNGLGTVHGGIPFSLADSAFAFACNAQNNRSVALDAHIAFTRAAREGDVLTAEAKALFTGSKTSVYDVRVTNQAGELVAVFKGTAFCTGKAVVPE